MSTLNANVFFELGIRTALDKPVCLVADSVTPDFPFDTGIIHRHTYEAVLRIWNIEEQKRQLVRHMKDTMEKAKGRNSLWRHFGIDTSGKFNPESYTKLDKLDYLIQMFENWRREGPRKLPRFILELDGIRVRDWAVLHKAKNPDNLGTRNWERCRFDLGLEGGVYHKLEFDDDGNLKYQ